MSSRIWGAHDRTTTSNERQNLKWRHFCSVSSVLALALVFLTSCREGRLDPNGQEAPHVRFSSLTIITYDTSLATLNVKGQLRIPSVTEQNTVEFHTNASCTGKPLVRGIEKTFSTDGLVLQVPSTSATKLYVATNTEKNCYYYTEFSLTKGPPPVPTFTSSSPASPSRMNSSPALIGWASKATTRVYFYDDNACTRLVGSGTSNELVSNGVQVTLTPNSESKIFVRAEEPFGFVSTCAEFATYSHSTNGPTVPVYVSATPMTPSRMSTAPLIKGTTAVAEGTVALYSEAGCSNQIGSGTTAEFSSSGVQISVNANTSTTIYGKVVDAEGAPSNCGYLVTYVHDNVPPLAPTYSLASPASPTRMTIYPRVTGHAPADAMSVRLFNAAGCLTMIGSGSKGDFESIGVLGGVGTNTTTSIYAASVDAAGNQSDCVYFTDFKHNTIAPDPPVFIGTDPISPNNQSTTPRVIGSPSARTVMVQLYSDEECSAMIGSGTSAEFDSPGIVATVPPNTITEIYSTVSDEEGNVSECTSLTSYAYSNLPAPDPVFSRTLPVSPSRTSYMPFIFGTVPTSVTKVDVYRDASCSSFVGSGSRLEFTATGLTATLSANAHHALYGMSTDMYGNTSSCTSLTTYTHANVAPSNPIYSAVSPTSPNNTTVMPTITGTAPQNPSSILAPNQVSLYDSIICVSQIGFGSPSDFSGAGVSISVGANAHNMVYAISSDAAGNRSNCTYLTTYTHSNRPPGVPTFPVFNPQSPSYTNSVSAKGSIGFTQDILPPTTVVIYSDSSCSTQLATGTAAQWTGGGFPLVVPANRVNGLYGAIFDEVGNRSACTSLGNFVHNDVGPANLLATQTPNGAVELSWAPDTGASPMPSYTLKRALRPGGPYTIIASGLTGTYFTDRSINDGSTYYYTVSASNNTGTSYDSVETPLVSTVGAPTTVASLTATSGRSEVSLAWTGFSSNLTFTVLRSTQRGGPFQQIATELATTSYVDRTVLNGTIYHYVIVGKNPAGAASQSNEAMVQPLDVPAAPTNLQVTHLQSTPACNGNRGILLNWTAPSYYTTFSVKNSMIQGSPSPWLITSQTSAVDCSPNTNVNNANQNRNYYAVAAKWGNFESPVSNEVVIANYGTPTLTLKPGNSQINLLWSTLSGAIDYRIKRSTSPNGPFTIVQSGVAASVYSDSGLVNGTTYYYFVEPHYGSGTFGWPSSIQGSVPGLEPAAPSNLVLQVDSNGNPELQWSAPTHFNEFYVYRAPSSGGPFTFISSVIDTKFVDAVPLDGRNYYQVTAKWASYETAATNMVMFRHAKITTLTATPTSTSINLAWSAVAGVSQYEVQRSLKSQTGFSVIATTASTSFSDTTVDPVVGYYYRIVATFADTTKGQPSIERSAMTTATRVPSGLTVLSTTSTSVKLIWSNVSSATSYRVYRSTFPDSGYTMITEVFSNETTISALSSNTTYYFKVTSLAPTQSAQSEYVQATTVGLPAAPLGTPGDMKIDLSWGFVAGATSYAVHRSNDAVNYVALASGLPSTLYTNTGLSNGQIYFYKIVATYGSGATAESPPSLGITPGVVPRSPQGISVVENVNGTEVVLSWSTISGTNAYRIYSSFVSGGPYTDFWSSTTSPSANRITGLTPGQLYYFVVSSVRGGVESPPSAELAIIPGVTPSAPTALVNTSSAVETTWASVSGAVEYQVQRSTNSATWEVIASNVAATSYVDSTGVGGMTYYYRYLPFAPGGVPLAVSSASAPVTPGISPRAPAQLYGSASSDAAIDLEWVYSPSATSYQIYRSSSSGGPYSLLAALPSTTTKHTDGTTVPGNPYYYVVTALNSSQVESPYSNEVGIELSGQPTGLAASAVNGSINLNWNTVVGASSYRVLRSEVVGGPYGEVAATASLNAVDTNVAHGITYHYVVEAVFASGRRSPRSAVASATGIVTMNLEVPIELTDRALASGSTNVVFERTQTRINPTSYDGAVTYSLEAVASNYESSARNVDLVDSAGASVGTLVVPALTIAPRRLRVTFTPRPSAEVYRLKLAATDTPETLMIYSSRVLIHQVGASKTRIYIPLLSSREAPSNQDAFAPTVSTQANSYADSISGLIYRREANAFSKLRDINAWELETLVATQGGAAGRVAFFNTTRGSMVPGTETLFTSGTVQMVRSPLHEGSDFFAAANEGENYQVRAMCGSGCTGGSASVYKAGLWVNLTQLTKARIYFRNGLGIAGLDSNSVVITERTLIDLSKFSNPVVRFEAVAVPLSGQTARVTLVEDPVNDSGPTGFSAVAGSDLAFPMSQKSLVRSSGTLTLKSGWRYFPEVDVGGGTVDFVGSTIVLDAIK